MKGFFLFQPSVLWISLWFVLNVSLTLLNKGLMVFSGFNFPVLMSFVHMAVSTFLGYLSSAVFKCDPTSEKLQNQQDKPDFESTINKRILYLSFLFSLNIIFGNSSLRHCSVAFVQVLRAIIPLVTMLLSVIFLKYRYTLKHYLACAVICVGVAFSCYGEINLTIVGFIICFVGCFLSSAKSISIKMSLSGPYELDSFDLLTRMSPIAAIEMFALVLIMGEDDKILFSQKYHPSLIGILGIILSGIIAHFLNLTNFYATHYTSPLTVTIAGCLKQVLTIVLSVMIFDKKMTITNGIGIFITTLGSLWYSLLRTSKPTPKQVTSDEQDEAPLMSKANPL